jgi:tetratricopeptide (TPR) repeat protein
MRREWLICLALIVITLTAFWPAGHLGFILYDDYGENGYIVDNTNIQAGITFESIRWAFTTTQASNWHPITWLSHMLDYKWFGLNASGHHWMNLGFHIANTLLLFIVLREMMGLRSNKSIGATTPQAGLRLDNPQQPYDSPPRNANKTANAAIAATTPQAGTVWRSALVAALFALHPTHIQSVAWISERKDVLSGFFMMLTLWAYARYAQKRSRVEGRESSAGSSGLALAPRRWTLDYFLALIFFALGLMSKPMLVTLPVILLLLDFWPLGRISEFGVRPALRSLWAKDGSSELKSAPHFPMLRRLIWEKAPFLMLSLASSVVTFCAQGVSVVPLDFVPWDSRIENALAAYTAYLGKTFWPQNLAIFYPYTTIPPWEVLGSGLLLIFLSVFCIRKMRFQPWLLVGWFWFLVMLVPVIGLAQVSVQSMADRYLYLPSIGLFIMVAWGLAGIASISSLWRATVTVGTTVLLMACLLETRYQLRYWRDSVTLFSRAIEVTGENPMGNYFLGNAFWVSGNLDEAAKNYRSVLRSAPNSEDVHYRLGYILCLQKKWPEAGVQFGEVLRLNPDNPYAHKYLGDTLVAREKFDEAGTEYATALQLRPDDVVIREAMALLVKKAETAKALASLYETLKSQPTAEAHARIAALRTTQGEFQDALEHYLAALRLKPDSPDVLNNLAWLLATCPDARIRDGAQAVKHAGRACTLTDFKQTIFVGTLAAAYAEAGRFDEAIATAQKACILASGPGEQNLLQKNQELLALYQKHQPYREAP